MPAAALAGCQLAGLPGLDGTFADSTCAWENDPDAQRPHDYAELQAFVAVAETLSFRKAAERLAQMTPPDHHAIIHVTLTDDHPWAQAFVVIEARPGPTPT